MAEGDSEPDASRDACWTTILGRVTAHAGHARMGVGQDAGVSWVHRRATGCCRDVVSCCGMVFVMACCCAVVCCGRCSPHRRVDASRQHHTRGVHRARFRTRVTDAPCSVDRQCVASVRPCSFFVVNADEMFVCRCGAPHSEHVAGKGTFVATWCPSSDHRHDRATDVCQRGRNASHRMGALS